MLHVIRCLISLPDIPVIVGSNELIALNNNLIALGSWNLLGTVCAEGEYFYDQMNQFRARLNEITFF